MVRVPDDTLLRNPQSFSLLGVHHLLDKLAWDMDQLELLRWDESIGDRWRQVVSYKAIDCATTVWHMSEWFEKELFGMEPCTRARKYLGIQLDEPWLRMGPQEVRQAAVKSCRAIKLCSPVATSSKHYYPDGKLDQIWTDAYLSTARRGTEKFQRPVIWLALIDGDERQDFVDVLVEAQRYWQGLWAACWPG